MDVGDRAELTIDALGAGGDGVGRMPDGLVVFVPYAAPGDRVRVRITQSRARFARARLERLLARGRARTEPLCPVFGSCGGCAWQHVAYADQVAAKRTILRDALTRLGGFELGDETPFVPSPEPYGYRRRTRVLVKNGRVGYRRRRSHALCETSHCPVLVPALDQELARLASDAPSRNGEWELEVGRSGVRAYARLQSDRAAKLTTLEIAGESIETSPGVFSQANVGLLEALEDAVVSAAGDGDAALELFAGAGFFTIGLARRFARVVAVESNRVAARDLERNVRRARLANVSVIAHALGSRPAVRAIAGLRPDAIVLDPPRTGLPRGLSERLAELGAARIVYLSCNPATLARDLASLARRGYRMRQTVGFDVFPQTPHVEALAVLERAP